jgi:hypothetical protein
VVAQRLGRRFIAVDRERSAFELAAARLERSGLALAAAGCPPRDLDLVRLAAEGAFATAPAG